MATCWVDHVDMFSCGFGLEPHWTWVAAFGVSTRFLTPSSSLKLEALLHFTLTLVVLPAVPLHIIPVMLPSSQSGSRVPFGMAYTKSCQSTRHIQPPSNWNLFIGLGKNVDPLRVDVFFGRRYPSLPAKKTCKMVCYLWP